MNNTLMEIVTQCVQRGIRVELEYKEPMGLVFDVRGFSKSGSARVFFHEGQIHCHTRYGREDVIASFEDLAGIAYSWFISYKDTEPFGHPGDWESTFVELGMLRVKTETITVKTYV